MVHCQHIIRKFFRQSFEENIYLPACSGLTRYWINFVVFLFRNVNTPSSISLDSSLVKQEASACVRNDFRANLCIMVLMLCNLYAGLLPTTGFPHGLNVSSCMGLLTGLLMVTCACHAIGRNG